MSVASTSPMELATVHRALVDFRLYFFAEKRFLRIIRSRNGTWVACIYRVYETGFVDFELTAARTAPHDGGVGRAADAPTEPEVSKHAPERIARKLTYLRL